MSFKKASIAAGAIQFGFTIQEGAAQGHGRHFSPQQLQQAADVGDMLAEFVSGARSSLHIAIYDFLLEGVAAEKFVAAINEVAEKGLDVRIAYFESPRQPTPAEFALLGSDPAIVTDRLGGADLHERVRTRGIQQAQLQPPVLGQAIEPPHNLMHSKYIVRDGLTGDAALLMGSANFTTDAWAMQENNIVIFDKCQALSAYYENDFSEMWQSGLISNTGNFDTARVAVADVPVQVMFAPGRGRQIGAEIAARIDTATKRLLLASMVISSGPILGAIADRMHRVDEFAGIYDGSEMHMIIQEWGRSAQGHRQSSAAGRRAAASAAKAQQFTELAHFLHYKKSLSFRAQGLHNFMHNKFAVIDDTVISGSFNFSTNAQNNAENVVIIESAELADAYALYLTELTQAYPETGVPD